MVPEPAPSRLSLRFVVLRHEGVDPAHFDILFETSPGSALTAWRSPVWPIVDRVELTRLPDHRRAYLDYEGPVSGDRGQVRRVVSAACRRLHVTAQRWVLTLDLPDPSQRCLVLETDATGQWHGRNAMP